MSKPKFTTPYSQAWDKFKLSDDFEDAADVSTLGTTPEHQRYLENRLRAAFDAGWNAKTSHILDALTETLKKK